MLNQKVNSLLSRLILWGNSREVEPAIEFKGPVFIGTRKENRDVNGYPRYYAHPAQSNISRYLITNEWFERNHNYYLKWLQKYVQH